MDLLKNIFFTAMVFSCNVLNVNPLECVSMNNQECRIRPEVININSNEPLFCLYSIKVDKCSGNCNNINPYAKLCVADVKNMNIKVFNLISKTNETGHVSWHETCQCKNRLDSHICNTKQCRCRCECKEIIEEGICNKRFIWNPSNCECECDKSCDVGEYVGYEDCKCRKKLIN